MRNSIIAVCAGLLGAGSAAEALPTQWATNGHYYEVIVGPLLGPDAEAAAESSIFMGAFGYLATIVDAAEAAFVSSLLSAASLPNALIGISDRETEGVYKFIGGPEEGNVATYLPWATNEPNDCCGGEDYVEIFPSGFFNDIAPPSTAYDARRAYVVEYSPDSGPNPIPLPAGMPLLLAGIGVFGLVRKSRS